MILNSMIKLRRADHVDQPGVSSPPVLAAGLSHRYRWLQPESPGADGIMYPVHDEKGSAVMR